MCILRGHTYTVAVRVSTRRSCRLRCSIRYHILEYRLGPNVTCRPDRGTTERRRRDVWTTWAAASERSAVTCRLNTRLLLSRSWVLMQRFPNKIYKLWIRCILCLLCLQHNKQLHLCADCMYWFIGRWRLQHRAPYSSFIKKWIFFFFFLLLKNMSW